MSVDLASVRHELREPVLGDASSLESLAVLLNGRTDPLPLRFGGEIVDRASDAVVYPIRTPSDVELQTAQTAAGDDLRTFTVPEFDGGTP